MSKRRKISASLNPLSKRSAKSQPGKPLSQKAGVSKARNKFPNRKDGMRTSIVGSGKSQTKQSKASKDAKQASQRGLSVPFNPKQRILLVGEGDFSFSKTLLEHHKCSNLVATTLETRSSLLEKHPQTLPYLSTLESHGAHVLYSIDATVLCHPKRGGGSNLRKLGPFDRIVFNFPHTGGLTKDVNRQVRANQELCVKFLESAAGVAADDKQQQQQLLAAGGRIVVTLFEGDPYELWGIKNLARHVGLAISRSTAFEWDAYPGYRHARTLGNLRGGGGWKGEDRPARMYIFGRPGEGDATEDGRKEDRESLSGDEVDSDVGE